MYSTVEMTFCVSTECRRLLVTFPLFLLLFFIIFTCSTSQIQCPLNRGHIALWLVGFVLELKMAVCVCVRWFSYSRMGLKTVQHPETFATLSL